MKEEIIAGLKNAMDRGDSIEKATNSFISAGYPPEEVHQAASELSSGPSIQNSEQSSGEIPRSSSEKKKQEKPKLKPLPKLNDQIHEAVSPKHEAPIAVSPKPNPAQAQEKKEQLQIHANEQPRPEQIKQRPQPIARKILEAVRRTKPSQPQMKQKVQNLPPKIPQTNGLQKEPKQIIAPPQSRTPTVTKSSNSKIFIVIILIFSLLVLLAGLVVIVFYPDVLSGVL